MATPQTEPPAIVRISTNTILNGKFYVAGDPLPFERAEDLPETLRPLVVTGDPEAEEPADEPRGAFELNTPYRVGEDNRLGRALRRNVEREIAELQTANAEADWIEEVVASAELPPEVAQDLQEAHQSHVGLQKAQLAAAATRADDTADAAIAAQEPPQLFVRRGDRHYIQIHRTKLKPAEPVFIREPDGGYQSIGICDAKAQPPDPPTIIA